MRFISVDFQTSNDDRDRSARAAGGAVRSNDPLSPRVTRENNRARDIYAAFAGVDTPEFQGTIGTRRRYR